MWGRNLALLLKKGTSPHLHVVAQGVEIWPVQATGGTYEIS